MPDFLDRLARDTQKTIERGYYSELDGVKFDPPSLREILKGVEGNPIIAEVKAASPSKGSLREKLEPVKLAEAMMEGGAAALSVLTEPKHFKGSIDYIKDINQHHRYPILMKDFIISMEQLRAASKMGASAVLLISTLYGRGYGELDLSDMIDLAHDEGLEVLLETHTLDEFKQGIDTDADLIGINNRDLKTLKTDTSITEEILQEAPDTHKMIISESGIRTARDIRLLRSLGVDAFLVGSAIMEAKDPENMVRRLVRA
jgi:indole-3-glycerol phosphate synthase